MNAKAEHAAAKESEAYEAARIAHADNDAKECEVYKYEERQRAADKKEWRVHHANKVKATDSKQAKRLKRHACNAATSTRAAELEG